MPATQTYADHHTDIDELDSAIFNRTNVIARRAKPDAATP